MLNNTGEIKSFKSQRALTNHINSIPMAEIAIKLGMELYKTGNSLQGNCPTGHSSTGGACFSINTKDNYWSCFNCKKGGDSISLVQTALGLGFIDALKWFSQQYSLRYSFEVKEKTAEDFEQEQRNKINAILYETAFKWMHEQLFDIWGKEALYYLTENRKYEVDVLRTSEFCAFPNVNEIKDYLLEQHPDLEQYIRELPLNGAFGDNFEVAFPYRDRYGKITGFIKRSAEPDGITFTKSDGTIKEGVRYDSTFGLKKHDLFGLHKIKNQQDLVIVEGYPDAIYFPALGMENIVAVGQGNLAKSHLEGLAMKSVKNAIISFDNDAVGPVNTERAVRLMLEECSVVPFVLDPKELDSHKDPDEYVRANGLDSYRGLLKKAQRGVIWCVGRVIEGMDNDALSIESKKQEVLNWALLAKDPSDLTAITKLMVKHFGMSAKDVKKMIMDKQKENRIEEYKKAKAKMLNTRRYVPFIETSTGTYAYWDKKLDVVHLGTKKEILENILASAGQKLHDVLPVLKADFAVHCNERIDQENEIFNLFVPTKYMLLQKTNDFIDPRRGFPHIYRLLSNLMPVYKERKRFINWLAGIMQTREKQLTSWVFKGAQGTGKGVFLDKVLKPIFGCRQAIQVEDDQLKSQFNSWLQNALLIAFNEVAHDNDTRNNIKSKLKAIITDYDLIINEKNVKHFMITNYVNCLFFSNEAVPVFIENGDRRFNVVRTGNKLEKLNWFNDDREAFFKALGEELQEFAQFLMNFKYNPTAAQTCINNAEKEILVSASMNRYEEFSTKLKNCDVDWFNTNLDMGGMLQPIRVARKDIEGKVEKSLALKLFNGIYCQDISNIQLSKQLKLYGILPERQMQSGQRNNFYLW